MTDTNDTFLAEDADGTPCLWLRTPGTGLFRTPALLLTKDDIRASVNMHKPNAHWGQASRDAHIDRLWAAIAATAGPAPAEAVEADRLLFDENNVYEVLEEVLRFADVGATEISKATERVMDLVQPGWRTTPEQVEAASAPAVPVEKVQELADTLLSLSEAAAYQSPEYDTVNTVWREAARQVAALLPTEPTS